MFTTLDYMEVVERTIERLRLLRKIIPDTDIETRMEVEYEINTLIALHERLKSLHPNISFLTMH